jgi:hypothetical protein
MTEKLAYDVPPYPCVIMEGEGNHIDSEGSGAVRKRAHYHIPLRSSDDLDLIENCRKNKRFSVVAYHNLDKPIFCAERGEKLSPFDQNKISAMLDATINNPEILRLKAELAAAKASEEKEALNERAKRSRKVSSDSAGEHGQSDA